VGALALNDSFCRQYTSDELLSSVSDVDPEAERPSISKMVELHRCGGEVFHFFVPISALLSAGVISASHQHTTTNARRSTAMVIKCRVEPSPLLRFWVKPGK
jgi:hypothetical protein